METAAVALRRFEHRHAARTRGWTNDPEWARLMDRAHAVTEEEHDRWFQALGARSDTMFFAVETTADARHIGNVWLAAIDRRHGKAEARIVIGDRQDIGQGFGSVALDLLAQHAFGTLGLQRLYAYVLAVNPRARRAFENAGFELEGTLRRDRRYADGFVDAFVLARLKSIASPPR